MAKRSAYSSRLARRLARRSRKRGAGKADEEEVDGDAAAAEEEEEADEDEEKAVGSSESRMGGRIHQGSCCSARSAACSGSCSCCRGCCMGPLARWAEAWEEGRVPRAGAALSGPLADVLLIACMMAHGLRVRCARCVVLLLRLMSSRDGRHTCAVLPPPSPFLTPQ